MSKVIAIVAADPNAVIGVDGAIPWHYKADFKRFKDYTMGGILVMGRKTFESIPPTKNNEFLPGRKVVVVSKTKAFTATSFPNVTIEPTIERALDHRPPPSDVGPTCWICGGADIYRLAFQLGAVDEIDFTRVPEVPLEKLGKESVRWNPMWFDRFDLVEAVPNPDDPQLVHCLYRRSSQG
jgi:dihydrofolate reductase